MLEFKDFACYSINFVFIFKICGNKFDFVNYSVFIVIKFDFYIGNIVLGKTRVGKGSIKRGFFADIGFRAGGTDCIYGFMRGFAGSKQQVQFVYRAARKTVECINAAARDYRVYKLCFA